MATNRADTLDPALLRPGRLDRKIEFPIPDRRQKRLVFQVCVQPLRQECVSGTGCACGAHLESSLRAASEAGAGHGIGSLRSALRFGRVQMLRRPPRVALPSRWHLV